MLSLGEDWKFEVDLKRSSITLSPKGAWSLKVVCNEAKVKSIGFGESFAPRLTIDGLPFDGHDWRDLVGLEVFQEGAWRGEGDPEASLFVIQAGDIYEAKVRIVGNEGTHLNVEIDGICDIFFDDTHDTNVPLRLQVALPFEGVRFRFRGDGAASLQPEHRASEILAGAYALASFGPPEVTKLKPGVFSVLFPPTLEAQKVEDLSVSAEDKVLHESATELLSAFVEQKWIELEDGGIKSLVPELVTMLELGGRGTDRAERVVEWLLERDEVIDLHCSDEQLGGVLDKWW